MCLQSAKMHISISVPWVTHIRSSLTDDMTTSIAVTLIHSRLDYANSLLYSISASNIHKLQRCQNMAARLILKQSFTPSVHYIMDRFLWLPTSTRIDFKIATLIYNTLSSGHLAYLRELISTNLLLAHCDPVVNFS